MMNRYNDIGMIELTVDIHLVVEGDGGVRVVRQVELVEPAAFCGK
jgi:hypothetical protein